MFREHWPLVKAGNAPRTKQDDSKASVFNFDWSIAEIDWAKAATQVWNLVRCISKPLSGAWTTIGGRKMHVWSVRVVEMGQEIHSGGAKPGQVLAVDGEAMWVQCGTGQVRIIDAGMDGVKVHPFDVLSGLGKHIRVVLGRN